MWTRADFKDRAKASLKGNYWKAFLISLVIIFSGTQSVLSGSNWRESSDSMHWYVPWGFIAALVGFGIVFGLAYRIFLGYPLEVGGRRYFVRLANRGDKQGCFTYAFSSASYMPIVKTMLLKGIFNFLWTLLLIIPGIVKYYAYIMTPYILAENPDMNGSEAIQLSMKMTRGHKFSIFVLDLSFLGWYILGMLALGIGVLFVEPYRNATYAELYLKLKEI